MSVVQDWFHNYESMLAIQKAQDRKQISRIFTNLGGQDVMFSQAFEI